ncbi:MAG TPA: hypothetical protein VK994_03055, partial [Bacteroidales bacterium]|nr:hypothetical protein [Bacteroidales bacterium]
DFLLRSLSINNQYDVNYKSSNNKRLHLELSLLQMCGLMGFPAKKPAQEKKMPELPDPNSKPKSPPQVKEPLPEMKKPEIKAVPPPIETKKEEGPVEETRPEAKVEEQAERQAEKPISREDAYAAEHLSIKKASKELNGDHKNKGEVSAPAKPRLQNDFNQGLLETVWQQCIAETCQHSANLLSSLSGKKPALKEGFKVDITLDNKVIEREFRVMLPEIHAYLRKRLQNDLVMVVPRLADIREQEDKAYFPDEIYKKMIEKNPEIKNMRDQLDLEIDF